MNDTRTATVRTTVNTTVLLYVAILFNWLFSWNITLDDLAPFAPIILGVVAVFYRLSLYVTARWPKLGWVLFGNKETPTYV